MVRHTIPFCQAHRHTVCKSLDMKVIWAWSGKMSMILPASLMKSCPDAGHLWSDGCHHAGQHAGHRGSFGRDCSRRLWPNPGRQDTVHGRTCRSHHKARCRWVTAFMPCKRCPSHGPGCSRLQCTSQPWTTTNGHEQNPQVLQLTTPAAATLGHAVARVLQPMPCLVPPLLVHVPALVPHITAISLGSPSCAVCMQGQSSGPRASSSVLCSG